MTDTKMALMAGKSDSYMRVLKSISTDRYKMLKKHGIQEFEDMCKDAKNKLAEIYWEIKDTEGLSFSSFYRSSKKMQYNYKSIVSLNVGISKFAFSSNKRTTIKGLESMSMIIEEYEKYKASDIK